ncbi:glucosaminidase domain-containing protein [Ferruginibacter albus]|uniref:glucosaminidase domain-containing protein n=1 Tax=Ferruginibacter albus TaxID=2875540 RepID=UPI001CC61095|nr:glucosaminidase domain-containing protein [Ferruginibacter albus]UAY52687.1 LysM peptidoglycan-binding domain-containing protein [Ferruginibacter albus]
MKKNITTLVVCILMTQVVTAQKITPEQYIATYKDIAMREMKRMGVPAAITLAQGLLETESGNSDLVKKSNNHFGIKCKNTWTAGGVSHNDDAIGECFRSYPTAEDSYRDHSNFLRGGDRYGFLFKLDPTDYKGWAYGLKKAGYATNPMYPTILIRNIEQYNLEQYSLLAAKDMPVYDPSLYQDDSEVAQVKQLENDNSDASTPVYLDAAGTAGIINNTKYIFASAGTSLLAIASKNNIDLNKLLEYNDMKKDGILAKPQIIFLQNKQTSGDKDFYIVKPGESLYDVSQVNAIQLQSLIEYNQLNESSQLIPGTKLKLKPQTTATLAPATNDVPVKANGNATIHNVQPKEGLYSIAKTYGVTVDQLKEWNNLADEQIQIGQQLIVSKP